MKRLTVLLFIGVLLVGTVYAQNRDDRQRNDNSVTIDGTLKLERGFVAVESGDSVYYVPMLNRYIGFINELSEGAKVSIEGREFRKFIHPAKVTINGKTYDFFANDRMPNFANNRRPNFENRNFDNRRENFRQGRDNSGSRQNNFDPRRNKSGPNRRNQPCRGACCG